MNVATVDSTFVTMTVKQGICLIFGDGGNTLL